MWRNGAYGETMSFGTETTDAGHSRRFGLSSKRCCGAVKLEASLQQDRSAVRPFSYDTLHVSSLSVQSDIDKELLDGNHIIISTQIKDNLSNISTHALVDCSATSYAFVDKAPLP